jgi:hypothetical protein
MKLTRSILATSLVFPLFLVSFLSFSVSTITAQENNKIALQRGYRTGYSDGYMAGYRDSIENSTRSIERHKEYAKADRAYLKDYGSLEEYRDGYQQGFESGYLTGFDKKGFNAALPPDLRRRGTVGVPKTQTSTAPATDKPPIILAKQEIFASQPSGEPTILIPVDTELVIELLDDLNTDQNKEGDKFQARIVSPNEINGAIVEGRIIKIEKPGRIKRRSELALSFDRIVLSDTRWSNFSAILTQVMPIKGDNIKKVDVEGTVEGQSSLKGDAVKVGASTGTGAVVGAVVAGPVGAAVGAGVGAAFGVGAVVVERGKHVNLTKGQQLKVRTAYETQIR